KSVCKFYYDFIKSIMNEPLFDIRTLNPNLFKEKVEMKTVKIFKRLLRFEKNYISICKFKDTLYEECYKLIDNKKHLILDDFFSLRDLYEIHKGTLLKKYNSVHIYWSNHIVSCNFCRIRGFLCEICQSQEIIF